MIPPKVTLVITRFVDVFPENPLDKLPLMCSTQNTVESNLEEVINYVDEEEIDYNFDDNHVKTKQMKKHRKVNTLHTTVVSRHLRLTYL